MPEYHIIYHLNLLDTSGGLHRFSCTIGYFESNSFTYNSIKLDSGKMRILLLDFCLEYLRYLPIASFVFFVIGGIIEPEYILFGEVIAPGIAA